MRTGALGVTTWIRVSCAKRGFEFLHSHEREIRFLFPAESCARHSHFAGAETIEWHIVGSDFGPGFLDAARTGCLEHLVWAREHEAVTSRALVLNAEEDFYRKLYVV
jgi:hypothetical protein